MRGPLVGQVALWTMAGALTLATARAQPRPADPAPPPRGAEQPRLQGMPGDRDNPIPPDRTDESFTPRVPILESTAHDDERQARRAAETVEIDTAAPLPRVSCADLALNERMTCPLERTARADRFQPIPGGVRVFFARSGKVSAPRLRQILACQAAAADTRRDEAPPCSFLGPERRAVVSERKGRVTVDIVAADREAAGLVRQEVRTALGGAARDQAVPRTSSKSR